MTIYSLTFPLCSPELEKGLKKRVKLHAYENGENGQTASRENGQHALNEDIDSDDNYTEVGRNQPSRERDDANRPEEFIRFAFLFFSCVQDIMSPLQEESGCEEDEGEDEEEGREEEEEAGFDSDESLVDSDSDSDEKGVFGTELKAEIIT